VTSSISYIKLLQEVDSIYYKYRVNTNEVSATPHLILLRVTKSREGHRLRLSENRVPRRIFKPLRDEVTGGWRKLCSEKLHNLYSSPNVMMMTKASSSSDTIVSSSDSNVTRTCSVAYHKEKHFIQVAATTEFSRPALLSVKH
jgi:hypothetical protein